MHTRRDVYMVADKVMVVHRASRVEYHIGANDTAGVDNRACTDHGTCANAHIGSDYGLWMASDNKLFTTLLQGRKKPLSCLVMADGNYDGVMGLVRQSGKSTQDRQIKKPLAG